MRRHSPQRVRLPLLPSRARRSVVMVSVLYRCSEPDININNSWYRDDKIPNIKSPLCTRGELNGPSAVWISQKMYSFISLEMGNVVITVNWSFWMRELWMKIQSFFNLSNQSERPWYDSGYWLSLKVETSTLGGGCTLEMSELIIFPQRQTKTIIG